MKRAHLDRSPSQRPARLAGRSLLAALLLAPALAACGDDPIGGCPGCPETHSCVEGECLKPCIDAFDCGPTAQCVGGWCTPQCERAADCPPYDDGCVTMDPQCVFRLCYYPGACGPTQTCVDGGCYNACQTFFDCRSAEACVDNVCTPLLGPWCTEHADCVATYGSGYECWEGSCRKLCTLTPCPLNFVCEDELCLPTTAAPCEGDGDCVTDHECATAQGTCLSGQCAFTPLPVGAACDDGLDCTTDDACDHDHTCSGKLTCDGALPDACSQDLGAIIHTTMTGECDFASGQCLWGTSSTPCLGGVCGQAPGGQVACFEDACNIGGVLYGAGTLRPDNDCQACDPDQATDWSAVQDLTTCDDGLWCTTGDRCLGGACLGGERDCASDQPAGCWAVGCDEDGDTCTYSPAGEGEACEDGEYCTVGTTCQSGACTGGGPRDCSGAADECNSGVCAEDLNLCLPQPLPGTPACTSDGLFCTGVERCLAGACGSPGDPCGGATPYCDDVGDACRACLQGSHCATGSYCRASDYTCQPLPPCQLRVEAGLGTTPAPDGDACGGTPGRCCSGACDQDGTIANSTFASDCRSGPSCLGSANWGYSAANNGQACTSNGLFCDGVEACSGGACLSPGTPCSGGTPYCDDVGDACRACLQGSHCASGSYCRASDYTCQPLPPCQLRVEAGLGTTPAGDGDSCAGTPGRCCSGACDQDGTIANSTYHADCRSGPSCLGSANWGYSAANTGLGCGAYSAYCANASTCDSRQRRASCASGACSGGWVDDSDSTAAACNGQTCDPNPGCSASTAYTSRQCSGELSCSQLVGADACELGCRTSPAVHCVQPSNWGYWSGTTPIATGVTRAWLKADGGGTSALNAGSGTVTINTDTATISGVVLGASDVRVIDQASYHAAAAGGTLPPGMTAGQIPMLVAFRLRSITVASGVTVNCLGSRPAVLATSGAASVAGTWNIRCGATTAGVGGSATSQTSQYSISGGGGGGSGGSGGASGTIAGGTTYGRADLQPLVPGSSGGSGFGTNDLYEGELNDHTSSNNCWWSEDPTAGCNTQNFLSWRTNTWDPVTTPDPSGGSGGGALQVVSLSATTLNGNLLAYGQGGQSAQDCAARTPDNCAYGTCTYDGGRLADHKDYPIKTQETYLGSGYGPGCPNPTACEDNPGTWLAATRRWTAWMLQTGGGGGSGGALLFEAPSMSINDAARISVEGGGGAAACYTQLYSRWMVSTSGGFEGAFVCHMEPKTSAGPGATAGTNYNPRPGGLSYPTLSGASGGTVANGNDRALGIVNSNNDDCIADDPLVDNDPVNFSTSQSAAWGGGGGGAGRIRINTPSGTVSCSGACAGGWQTTVFTPDPGTLVVIGTFPASGNYQN